MRGLVIYLLAIVALYGCGGTQSKRSVSTVVTPEYYTYEVVAEYPHSRTSYTQGLQYIDGTFWEGTGQFGSSVLQTVDIATGRTKVIATLARNEFGEGITVLGDKIFQLTWQNRIAHIYDRASGRLLRNVSYNGEGWGLTSDGEQLFMSDGTSIIRVLDPTTFRETRRISVLYNGESLPYLNELEWIDGRIWANVYTTDQIVVINPQSGAVEQVIDLAGILPESEYDHTTDVLNGIAYDSEHNRIYVTGKNWSKLYEIKIFKK